MCLIALAIGQSARFPLVLASNRDEFFDRPTSALDWWWPTPEGPAVLAGRDLQAGGSWLGLSATGRLALVTNVRDGQAPAPAAPSRGSLVTDWLLSSDSFEAEWARLAGAGHNGFNLIAADLARGDWRWGCNRIGRGNGSQAAVSQRLAAGLHGLSNAALDTPWPKVERLKAALRSALAGFEAERPLALLSPQAFGAAPAPVPADDCSALDGLVEQLFAALGDAQPAEDAGLPATGLSLELERQLSAAFIRTPDGRYGTRCSTLVITEATAAGQVMHVIERSFGVDQPDDASAVQARSVERRARLALRPEFEPAGAAEARPHPAGNQPQTGKRPQEPSPRWLAGPTMEPVTERMLPR